MKRAWLLALACLAAAPGAAQRQVVRMMAGPAYGIPPRESTNPRNLARRAVFDEFHRRNPDIQVVNAGGLELTGDKAESNFLMSMAGDTAPDVFYMNFRQYFSYVEQGFCRPLDDLVAQHPRSAERMLPEVETVLRSMDGRLYGVPFYQVAQALYYRKDHFAEAGLDPARPPKDWAEFLDYARRLTESHPGRSGFSFEASPGGKAYHWTNFVWQAGGEVLVPAERGYSRAVVASPEAATALDYFRKLTKETWTGRDGKPKGPAAQISATHSKDINEGKVSMWFAYTNDVMFAITDVSPSVVGVAAMPAGPAGSYNEINSGMWAVNSRVRDPARLAACWRFIEYFAGQEAAEVQTRALVDLDLAKFVNPALLVRYGYEDLAKTVDPAFRTANEQVFARGKPEPYGRNSQQVYVVLDEALDRARLEDTPSLEILKDVERTMNAKLLGYVPEDAMRPRRTAVLAGLAALALGGAFLAVRAWARRPQGDAVPEPVRRSGRRFALWCLAPAVLSIALWAYYPLAQGLAIAFQDYRIVRGTRWVGVDNFVAVFTQPVFWKALWNSFLYVGLTILIGFLLPILLAVALNEIRYARVFFRVLFYLPAMTSGAVIAFLWRQFYDKAPEGLLNQMVKPFTPALNAVLSPFGGPKLAEANDWLGNPQLALFAVVLPGIWAAAGPGSVLYLAALKNIPDERYEAADLDGASWWHKLRFVLVPGLRPLMLINLLGVFIGGFKAMENVFVLTGGGPLYATHTVGLEVWQNAFMFLKFGYATAAAWVMGSILVGFTVVQIRWLTRLKFSAAGA
jgi:multiple sugar transport system permease protein